MVITPTFIPACKKPSKNQLEFLQACEDDDVDTVSHLIDKVNIDYKYTNRAEGNEGDTALIIASRKYYTKIVNLLIKNGADVNIKNNHGFNALCVAAFEGAGEIVDILVENGSDINEKGQLGSTALLSAVVHSDYDSIELLMECGADINIGNDYNKTPLSLAFELKNYTSMLLLKNINDQNEDGNTLIMELVYNKDDDGVMFFIDKGADLFVKNNKGETLCDILKNKTNLPKMLVSLRERLILNQMVDDAEESIGFGL